MHVAVSREPDLNTNEKPVGLSQASYMGGLLGGQVASCKLQGCTAPVDKEDDAPAEARGARELLQLGLMHDAPAQSKPGDVPGARG